MKDAIIATVINNDKVCEVFLRAVTLNQVFRLPQTVEYRVLDVCKLLKS